MIYRDVMQWGTCFHEYYRAFLRHESNSLSVLGLMQDDIEDSTGQVWLTNICGFLFSSLLFLLVCLVSLKGNFQIAFRAPELRRTSTCQLVSTPK